MGEGVQGSIVQSESVVRDLLYPKYPGATETNKDIAAGHFFLNQGSDSVPFDMKTHAEEPVRISEITVLKTCQNVPVPKYTSFCNDHIAYDVEDKDFDVVQSILRRRRTAAEEEKENWEDHGRSRRSGIGQKEVRCGRKREESARGEGVDCENNSLVDQKYSRKSKRNRRKDESDDDWIKDFDIHIEKLDKIISENLTDKGKALLGCIACSTCALLVI